MRKIYLVMSFVLASLCASAQEAAQPTPVITLTAEAVDDTEHELDFGSAVADNVITIDWGDGNIVEGATLGVYDGWDATAIKGKAVGTGVIKIYATGELSLFECVSNIESTGYTDIDVSNATGLTKFYANGNKLTTIDLSKNTKLETVYLNNNQLTSYTIPESVTYLQLANNKLTSFDGSKFPNVTALYLSDNQLTTLDLSGNLKIKNLYALNNQLESLNLGKNTTAKLYVSVNNNKLTSLDVTEATGLGTKSARLFATGNNLSELKYTALTSANLTGNKFTLATLPTENITTLTYAPQQAMEVTAVDGVVDLSAQNNIVGLAKEAQTTTYIWKYVEDDTELVAGTDYTEADGVFTFATIPTKDVYCTMATAAFPKFTGTNIFKTATVDFNVPKPAIILKAEAVDDTEHELDFGSAVADNVITIDWGDGNIVEGATLGVYDGWDATAIKGKAVGTGVIKIYATGELSLFECVSNIESTGYTDIDVSNATGLTKFYANGNKLTTIDLSKNTKLETVYLNNNQLTSYTIPESVTYLQLANNKLTSFDGSKFPNVTALYLSDNQLTTLDLSGNLKIKNLYALNNQLESLNLGKNTTAKLYVSVNNNKLTSLDVTEATGLGTKSARLFAIGNNLSELKYTAITTANLTGNKFTLATLPTENITTLTYAPQQAMEIEAVGGVVDLSAQTNVKGLAAEPQTTTYTWYTEDGTQLAAGADYTEADGVFTFTASPAQPVYCTMSTAAFPNFKGTNIFKTTTVTISVPSAIKGVEALDGALDGKVYNVAGQYVQNGTKGLKSGTYIVRSGAKAVKILVK